MDGHVTTDPVAFRDGVSEFVRLQPIATNVISVVNQRMINSNAAHSKDSQWISVVDRDDVVVGVAMANGPWNLFVSPMPHGAPTLVAASLWEKHIALPGVIGEVRAAREFVAAWSERTGCQARQVAGRHAYVLGELQNPLGLDGSARACKIHERDLVAEWLSVFHDEALPDDPVEDWMDVATQRIEAGELWAWTNEGEVVSLAAHSPSVAGVARIGPVYTPRNLRGRGFGAGATAAATQAAIDRGAHHVMLYADAANATSNALYQRLGYVHDHDAEQYRFIAC